MMEYIFAFFGIFVTDILYTFYVRAVNSEGNRAAFMGSLFSMGYHVLSALIIINYTANNWLLIAVAAGAFVGSYIGIKYKKLI